MRRIKLVLGLATVMVAMLIAFSAPAVADLCMSVGGGCKGDFDFDDHGKFFVVDDFDKDFDKDFDHRGFFISNFNDDCEWEFEEGWFLTHWGWQWGAWVLDC